jgi:predicted membrane chloride channel (bestrophin family)
MMLSTAHNLEYTAIPAMFFISMVLFGIEEIGVQIEEPLSILDLKTMVEDMVDEVDEACLSQQAVSGACYFARTQRTEVLRPTLSQRP